MVTKQFFSILSVGVITVSLGGISNVSFATIISPAANDVSLTVNTTTGDAALVFNNPSAQFYGWEITSSTGGLSYANLTDLPDFGSGLHAKGPTSLDGVYSSYATGGYYNPGGTWNIGNIITPADIVEAPTPSLDFSFNEFDPNSGYSDSFDSATINYIATVPEPAAIGLFALAGMGLLLISQKRNKTAA